MKLFKGNNEEMVRIIAIAAALLIMFIIIGLSIHSINTINETNQKRKEKENAKEFAASVAQTTATTSIWDALRSTTTVEPVVIATDEEGNIITDVATETETESFASTEFIVTMN